jgi:alginate O-acetyltransferase complex protein AlgI
MAAKIFCRRISVVTEMTDRSGRRRRRVEDVGGRWAPPALWVALALIAGPHLPAWGWMWLLAAAVFAGCKWATWWPHRFEAAADGRLFAYGFGYAGMDAEAFFHGPPVPPPRTIEWLAAFARVAAGAALIWCVARHASPMLAGWCAMIGLVLLLHFGVLDLIALAWRARGVDARPLMDHPTRAKSLADFWGRRWNTGFRSLAHELIFDPLRSRFGATGATTAVFLFSGLVHDLVISVPARGGYGGPTAYFLCQLAGLLFERSNPMRRLFARHSSLGRAFTLAVLLAPLPLLFHDSFVRRVILPFLNAIGGVL